MMSLFSEGMWMIPLYGLVFILFVLAVTLAEAFFDARNHRKYIENVRRYYARRRF
jgi:hypothetical protein